MKTIKNIIVLLILTSTLVNCHGHTKKTSDDPSLAKKNSSLTTVKPILLGRYLIDPGNKTVSIEVYQEWDEPNGIHAWGTSNMIIEEIDFETTCLYVTDSLFRFKEEHYNLPQLTFVDAYRKPQDISEFKSVSTNIYEKDNIYYFSLDYGSRFYELRKLAVESSIHIDSLTFAGQNFYYDNQGLYYVGPGDDGGLRLFTVTNGKNCHPIIKRTHCEYNGAAFGAGGEKINASLSKLYEIDINRDGRRIYLTDGDSIFRTRNNSITSRAPGLKKWKQLTIGQKLDVEDNCVDLSVSLKGTSGDVLFFSPKEGFFTTNFPVFNEKVYYKKVIIFNYDKNDYEEIDVSRFELGVKDFFIYRDKLHYMGIPIANGLNAAKLRYIGNTEWLSDGKSLIHLQAKKSMHKDGIKKFSFEPEVLVPNMKELKVVSETLLVDDVNFYQLNDQEIEIIPIESLGVQVEIGLSNRAWTEKE